jgi:5S rRNA maturation endonuclease (ribonuclease M5)
VCAALDELGIEYRVHGDEANALCPNPQHDDISPSWYCNIETGMFQCFSCQWRGPFVKLVRAVRGGGDDQAALWCQTRSSGRLRPLKGLGEVFEPVRRAVAESSLALFVPPPARELEKRRIVSDVAAELGVLWDDDDRSWILPFRDAAGKLRGWQVKQTRGKKLVRNYPAENVKKKEQGVHAGDYLFGLHVASRERAVLVESPLDVARLRTAGETGGVSCYGAGISTTQFGLIAEYFPLLISALDNDRAGREVSEKIRREFRRMPVRFFDYSVAGRRVKDPGDMLDDEIQQAIDNAIPALTARF